MSEKVHPAASNVIYINGTGNVVAGRDVVNVQKPPAIRNVIQPGPEHIDDAQRRVLFDLRAEWVALHNTLKKRSLTDAAAWARINKAAGSTSYHLIRRDKYEVAVQYVRREMAILRSMKSAPRKDDEWRTKKIGAIKARCKNQFGGVDVYKPYIKKNFGAVSLADLATDELQKTYAYVMAKKAA
jgi:hypothetical protein